MATDLDNRTARRDDKRATRRSDRLKRNQENSRESIKSARAHAKASGYVDVNARPHHARPRIAPTWLVLVLASTVAITFYATHPRGGLRQRMTANAVPSDLSVAYLEAWLRIQPDNAEFLSMLGMQYARLGQADDAERIASRMDALHDADMTREATMLRMTLAEQVAFAMAADDPARPAAIDKLRQRLRAAAQLTWSNADLQALAKRAAAADDPELASQLYDRLSQQDAAHRTRWNELVSRYALSVGNYQKAADGYFARQDAATSLDDKRRYFIDGVRTLQAGNLLDAAVNAGEERAGALANDKATLVVLLNLARAAGRLDLVQRYATALAKYASIGHMELADYVRHMHADRPFSYMDGSTVPDSRRALAQETGSVRVMRVSTEPTPSAAEPADPAVDVASLVYQSFLESRDLGGAQKIATEQVGKNPRSALWQKRLATVAEWNNAPLVADHAWLAYAQITNDPEGWKNVLRLAPMLDDDVAYLAGQKWQSNASPDNLVIIDQVVATYERLGRPADAYDFLRTHQRGNVGDAIDERSAALAQRAGYDDKALALYRELQKRHPDNPTYALRVANILFLHTDLRGAFDALRGPHETVSSDNLEYWRNYGELAILVHENAAANEAFKHVLANGHAQADDLSQMRLFYDPFPIDAARTAELEYRQSHTVDALQAAVYYYTEANAYDRIGALLDSLSPDQLAAAESAPAFLGARAEYYRLIDRPLDALRDLKHAVDLPGATTDVRAALLWTLTDYGSDEDLRRALTRWRDESKRTSVFWGPYAAGELRLNRAVEALTYLRLQTASLSHDPLWMLTYADAQEMAGRTDLAWSIRRSVWRDMQRDELAAQEQAKGIDAPANVNTDWTAPAGKPDAALPAAGATRPRFEQDAEARENLAGRRVALGVIFSNGDVSKALLDNLIATDNRKPEDTRRLRSLLGDTPGVAPLPSSNDSRLADGRLKSAVAKETAIAWALSKEANPLAKRWLARQYATRLAQPVDAQLTIALAENNTSEMERLLVERGRLPRYDRIDATIAVDRPGEAEQLAFNGLNGAPDDPEMHARLQETATLWPQSFDAGVDVFSQHPLDYVEQTLGASVKLGDHYLLGVQGDQRFQRSTNDTELVNVPSIDRAVNFTARRQSLDTAFQVSAGRREALDSFYTFGVGAEFGRNSPLTLDIRANRNQQATESQELEVGGVKDNVIAAVTYRFTPSVYMNGSVEGDRFYSQARGYLGSGVLSTAELGYKFRTEYPDYTVRIVGIHGGYGATGTADQLISRVVPLNFRPLSASDFVPQTYTQYGAFFTFGTELMQQYTHAWRPFLDIGIAHDSIQGWGPQLNVGIAGTVFGGDHAVFYIEHESVSQRGTPVTVIGARYSFYY